MNAWLLAAIVTLVAGFVPCLVLTLRGSPVERLLGLELGNAAGIVILLMLARGFGRSSYIDVALILSLLSLAGALVFARFFGRTL